MQRTGLLCALLLLLPLQLARAGDHEADVAERVDRLFETTWRERDLTPTPPTRDAEFLRRVWLDLVGRIPPAQATRAFLASEDPHKRAGVIEELLADPLYVKHWSGVWEGWLIKSELKRLLDLGGQARVYSGRLRSWLAEKLAAQTPYDQIARELLTAEGATDENGAVVFLARWENPINRAILTNRIFSGVCMNCVLYHGDTKWHEEDYWGMVAFFARTRRVPIRGVNGIKAFDIFEGRRGETKIPMTSTLVAPNYFIVDGLTPPVGRRTDRRALLADLVTSPGQDFFGKALVNRLWAYFFGRGFVTPLDASLTIDSTHPEVHALLARDFVEHGHDLKRLVRILVSTRVYQLSSRISPGQERDPLDFSTGAVRPMSSGQLFNSLLQAIGALRLAESSSDGPGRDRRRAKQAQKLYERSSLHFMYLFDSSEVTEDGLDYARTPMQALFMSNSRFANEFTLQRDGTLKRLWRSARRMPQAKRRSYLLESIFLAALSRPPSESERARFGRYLDSNGETLETCQDMLWVLLNSTEFLFNH